MNQNSYTRKELSTSAILDDTGIYISSVREAVNNYSPARVDQLFDDVFGMLGNSDSKLVKPQAEPLILDVPTDPLAVVLHMKKTNNFATDWNEWHFLNCGSDTAPLEEDLVLAAEIRNYYIDKILMQKMSGTHIDTQYKRELQRALLLSAENKIQLEHIPILYRLEDFYQEDLLMESVVKSAQPSDLARFGKDQLLIAEPLSYLNTVLSYRKGSAIYRAFFTDSAQQLVSINFIKNNPLRGFLELALSSRMPLRVSGKFSVNLIRDHDFQYISVVPDQVEMLSDNNSA